MSRPPSPDSHNSLSHDSGTIQSCDLSKNWLLRQIRAEFVRCRQLAIASTCEGTSMSQPVCSHSTCRSSSEHSNGNGEAIVFSSRHRLLASSARSALGTPSITLISVDSTSSMRHDRQRNAARAIQGKVLRRSQDLNRGRGVAAAVAYVSEAVSSAQPVRNRSCFVLLATKRTRASSAQRRENSGSPFSSNMTSQPAPAWVLSRSSHDCTRPARSRSRQTSSPGFGTRAAFRFAFHSSAALSRGLVSLTEIASILRKLTKALEARRQPYRRLPPLLSDLCARRG